MLIHTTRLFEARTDRVIDCNSVEAIIHVGFGLFCKKRIMVSGELSVPENLQDAAMHCLVTMCGGKSIIVETDMSNIQYLIRGRILIPANNPPAEVTLAGAANSNLIDVGRYMHWLHASNFDVRQVRYHLNGTAKGV